MRGEGSAYGGALIWDVGRAEEVLPVWADWAARAPREVTTSFRLLAVPPLPAIPAPLRGRRLVVIDGAVPADETGAAAVLAPLRALHPETDTVRCTPTPDLTHIHLDPEEPAPGIAETVLLADLPAEAVDAFLAAAGPGSGSGLLFTEVRQLGGALADPHPERAVPSHLVGKFLVAGAGLAVDADAASATQRDALRLVTAMQPRAEGAAYLNGVEYPFDTSTVFTPDAWTRLQQLRATYDPRGVLHTPTPR